MQETLKHLLETSLWKQRMKTRKIQWSHEYEELVVDGDPYEDGGMAITFKFQSVTDQTRVDFYVRIHALESSCGVLEINRPSIGYPGNQKLFDFFMDLVWEGLQKFNKSEYTDRWGNQILATTSSESCLYYVNWLKKNKWVRCGAAENPRSRHIVAIWRKVL